LAAPARAPGDEGFSRDEIVICTKGGYLPFDGAPPRDVRRYLEETFVAPGSPASRISWRQSLHDAGVFAESIGPVARKSGPLVLDVYYIHNPESQLGAVSREEFYSRLRAAFAQLEKNVAAGKIRMYGVATWNGFRVAPETRNIIHLNGWLLWPVK